MGRDAGDFDEAEQDQAGDRHAGFVVGPGPGGEAQVLGQERPALFAIPREADFAQPAGQGFTRIHQLLLSMGRTSIPRCSCARPCSTPAVGSGLSTGLEARAGMMRIPPLGAGTTRISPRKISRRMMAWASGRWAFA